MTRDTQRSKVYAWERTIPAFRDNDLTLEECENLIIMICQRYSKRIPLLKDGRGTCIARGSGSCISLPIWARSKVVVAHESTHSILEVKLLEEHSFHGPEFMRTYIDILAWLGIGSKRDLARTAREAGIRIGQAAACIQPKSWKNDLEADLKFHIEKRKKQFMEKYKLSESEFMREARKALEKILTDAAGS